MLERAITEASIYGLEAIHDPELSMGEAIVLAFRKAGLQDIADYWYGNFVVFGIL